MNTTIRDEFKRIEGIAELEGLVGQLLQFYNPKSDEYVIGKLKNVYESTRIVNGEEETDIVIDLKDGVKRIGKSIPLELYEKMPEKYSAVHIPRVKKRGVEYMVMLPQTE